MSTEQDYAAAADWAEKDMRIRAHSPSALRGGAAASYGRSVVEAALGGAAEMPTRAAGRPSIDPDAGAGQHSKVRQVRLPASTNKALDDQAAAEGRKPSAVLRDAVVQYLAAHRAG